MKITYSRLYRRYLATGLAVGLALVILAPAAVQAQTLQDMGSRFNSVVGNRVETLTIIGGDYGISGGSFTSFRNPDGDVDLSVSKFGGAGDIGDPQPIGSTGIGWQPRLQGEMGYVTAKKTYTSGALQGDTTDYKPSRSSSAVARASGSMNT